jgi:hypothetical protein
MTSLSVRVARRHLADRVGKALAANVASRYIQAMDLDKWPAKKQLEMLKSEHRRVSDDSSGWHHNDTQAQNVRFYMKGVAGWEVEAVAAPDRGFLVTAPNGKTFRATRGTEISLASWLRDETQYLDALADKVAEINRGMKKERLVKNEGKPLVAGAGTCPACFGGFKLRTRRDAQHPRVVLHGYQRPGWGFVEGRCFGVDYPPFELSPEGSKAWLEQLVITLKGLGESQVSLKKTLREPTSKREQIDFVSQKGEHGLHHERFTPDHPDWDKAVKRYRSKAEDDLAGTVRLITQIKAEIKDLKRRIATWKPRELT